MDRRRVDWSICWLDHIGYTIQWLGGLSVGKLVIWCVQQRELSWWDKQTSLQQESLITALPLLPLHIAHPSTKSSIHSWHLQDSDLTAAPLEI